MGSLSDSKDLLNINWELKSNLPLSSLHVPETNEEHNEEILNYFVEQLIEISSECEQGFIRKILHRI